MERIFRGFGWAYSAARGQRTASSGADFSDFFDAIFGGMWGRNDEDANSTEFRPGRDLQAEATLTLEEAFSGAYRVVSLNDGRKVEISIPAGVSDRLQAAGARSGHALVWQAAWPSLRQHRRQAAPSAGARRRRPARQGNHPLPGRREIR